MKCEKTRSEQEILEAVKLFSDMLFRIALSYTKNWTASEDILQDVFLHLLTDHTSFRDQEHQKAWLIRVTVNECRKFHRSLWNRRNVSLTELGVLPASERSEVFDLVMALPAKYRIIVHLYYYEGYSIREVSQILSIKESTAQSRLHRARKKLKKEMEVSDENSGL